MIHKFLTALEKYGNVFTYEQHYDAEKALIGGYNQILEDIRDFQLSQPDYLKHYAINLLKHIKVYYQKNLMQRNELEEIFNKRKSNFTYLEAQEHGSKVDYLKTMYNFMLDAEYYLVEHLIETGNSRLMLDTHYHLYNALIFASNESEEQPISEAFEILKKAWFFINSDNASFKGKAIKKSERPFFVNPTIVGRANFDDFLEAEIWFDSKMDNIKLTEQDFKNDIIEWTEIQMNSNPRLGATRLRKYNEFLGFLKNKFKDNEPLIEEPHIVKYNAKHYVLAYLFECHATGQSLPIGEKKELERIGDKRIGIGKGNRFYKIFNECQRKDLNVEEELIGIGGENWRTAVIKLSEQSELVEKYLLSKQL